MARRQHSPPWQVKLISSRENVSKKDRTCRDCEKRIPAGVTHRLEVFEEEMGCGKMFISTHLGCGWEPESEGVVIVREFTEVKGVDRSRT